jgi:hypothetical protein
MVCAKAGSGSKRRIPRMKRRMAYLLGEQVVEAL